jgi:predicted permease
MIDRPPRLAERLIAARLSGDRRDFVLGDLEEEFAARAAVSPPDARRWYWRQAIRCLRGGASMTPNTLYPPGRTPLMRSFLADLRLSARVFRRAPSFAAAVVAVLALGIGANTAIFSIVNAVLLRPLPFDQPDQLVRLFHIPPQSTFPGIATFSLSPANYLDWQRESRSFEAMAAYRVRNFTLTGGGEPEALRAAQVAPEFFRIVRTAPALGRTFLAEEFAPARSHVVLLSDGFWKRQFGGRRDVVGQTLTFDGERYTVVGVMPPAFSLTAWGATAPPMWMPLAWTDKDRAVRENHNYNAVARLAPGVTLGQANAELDVISKRLEQQYPGENAGWGGTAIPLHQFLVGSARTSLLMLLGAVGLVLLIACANVGNLILARAMTRKKEIAIRAALGAGRGRLFQHLIAESLLLAAAGGAAGVLLANLALSAGASLLATQVARASEASVDLRVLLFAAGASIATGLLAGLVPSLRAGRTDLNETLKEGGRSDASGAAMTTRRVLIVAEVALSLMLLMGAGVMIRSLYALRHVDAGFTPDRVLTMTVTLPDSRYPQPAQRRAFYDALLERVRALPGVESAGLADTLPASGGGSVQPLVVEGRPELKPSEQPTVSVRHISSAYLRTMRIPIVKGRDFTPADRDAMLVSRAAARLLWGDADPVGSRATLPLMSREQKIEVVGVVGDVKETLAEKAPPTVYYYQHDLPFAYFSLAIRTAAEPAAMVKSAVAAVHGLDAQLPVQAIQSMQEVIEDTLVGERFRTLLLELFAAAALTLATVGIYSVLSYLVRGRRREIGIRTALGAGTADVLRLVIVEGMKPALLGIAIGIAGALLAARLLEKLVFGVKAYDPLTLAVVAAALLTVSIAASLLPAWRAARLDPVSVLRD